jgi:hypothetical protein
VAFKPPHPPRSDSDEQWVLRELEPPVAMLIQERQLVKHAGHCSVACAAGRDLDIRRVR